MRTFLLVRHAKAGERHDGDPADAQRPLTKKGRRQADNLAATLGSLPLAEVRNSPALRCVQTVEPLCRKAGVELVIDPDLMEGNRIELNEEDGVRVLCAHGDNIPDLLEQLGIEWHACKKGSVWLIRFEPDGDIAEVGYAETPDE